MLEDNLDKKGWTYGFEIDTARGARLNAEPDSGGLTAEDLPAFAVDHPDIYELAGNSLKRRVTNGEITRALLQRSGFGI